MRSEENIWSVFTKYKLYYILESFTHMHLILLSLNILQGFTFINASITSKSCSWIFLYGNNLVTLQHESCTHLLDFSITAALLEIPHKGKKQERQMQVYHRSVISPFQVRSLHRRCKSPNIKSNYHLK